MKIECILQLMKEKGYISISEYSEEPMPPIYLIRNHRGKQFGSKLFYAISEDYLADFRDVKFSEILFAKKEDIDEWLEQFTEENTRVKWNPGRLDSKIFKYMEEKNFRVSKNTFLSEITVTNLKIRNERLKKIEKKNQEAIDLLDQLL